MTKIPAETIFAARIDRNVQRWPDNVGMPDCRLNDLCFPVLQPKFKVNSKSKVFTVGSCFARNIEEYLGRLGLNVPTLNFSVPPSEWNARPQGILNKYTPPTILSELEYALDSDCPRSAEDHFIEISEGQFVDMHLVSRQPVTWERAIERRAEIRRVFAEAANADLVVITLGLIECWFDQEKDCAILQAPSPRIIKKYPGRFSFKVLSIDEARDHVFRTIKLLIEKDPNKKILLTTSPVPLEATFTSQDVLVANMYSKSVLRVVAQEAKEAHESVDYFPSYETVMLSSRKVAWEADGRHVSDSIVGNIVGRVAQAYISDIPTSSQYVTSPPSKRWASARTLLSEGNADAALWAMKEVQADFGDDEFFLRDFLMVAKVNRAFTLAAEIATKLTDINPANARYVSDLGNILKRLNRRNEAAALIEQARTLDPENLKFLMDSAHSGFSAGQFSESEASAREAIRIAQIRGNRKILRSARVLLAEALFEQGKFEEAITVAFQASRMNVAPEYAEAAVTIHAKALLAHGKRKSALSAIERAIENGVTTASVRILYERIQGSDS